MKGIEKYLVRKAFDRDDILPSEVLWRTKEALSDGVSSKEDSWHMIMKKFVDTRITDDEYEKACAKYQDAGKLIPTHKEAYYYRKLYEKHFGELDLIPYYWLPQWVEGGAIDPSARDLQTYNNIHAKQLID